MEFDHPEDILNPTFRQKVFPTSPKPARDRELTRAMPLLIMIRCFIV